MTTNSSISVNHFLIMTYIHLEKNQRIIKDLNTPILYKKAVLSCKSIL
jgi:hypothetical protein